MTKPIALVLAFACCGMEASAIQSSPRTKIEFRLAETKPGKGLIEAIIPTSNEKIYLHKAVVLDNNGIAAAQLGSRSSDFCEVELDFTDQGASKMEKATKGHLNRPLAILIDGRVVAAPILRSAIRDKAHIDGVSIEKAERIVGSISSQPRSTPPSQILALRSIKFEMRLAESTRQKGCREAAVRGARAPVYLHKDILLSNKDVVEARAVKSHYNDAVFTVLLTLTSEGGERMMRAGERHIGKPMAVLINGKVMSAPFIIGRLSNDAEISGEFTKDEAEKIASLLNRKSTRRTL